MAVIEQYGDLSGDKLLDFLREIGHDDDEILAEEQVISEEIQTSDPETNDSEPEVAMQTKCAIARRNRHIDIQRMAFNQTDINLSDKIPTLQLRLLVELLTAPHSRAIAANKRFVNNRIAKLLRPHIPGVLRYALYKYPNSVKASAGFMYKASEEYGNGLLFWVTPLVPHFFAQGTEMDILQEHKEYLFAIDKAILRFDFHKKELMRKEINYAVRLLNIENKTYFDLLKLNPYWFEKLYKYLTAK